MGTVPGKVGATYCDMVHGNGTGSENHNSLSYSIYSNVPITILSYVYPCLTQPRPASSKKG